MSEYTREHTAHHEAGHAVISYFLGLGVRFVSIVPQEHFAGNMIDGGEYSEDEEAAALRTYRLGPVAVHLLHARRVQQVPAWASVTNPLCSYPADGISLTRSTLE